MVQGDIRVHPVRGELEAAFNRSALFLVRSEEWQHIMEASTFAFCPRGWRPTSFRLFEAIQLGAIPIYVWEEERWLPYEEIIDWSTFAFVVERREIGELPGLQKGADVAAMQRALAEVRHMFTYDYTVRHIVTRVQQLG